MNESEFKRTLDEIKKRPGVSEILELYERVGQVAKQVRVARPPKARVQVVRGGVSNSTNC
jgi:hypothetical protein